MAGGVALAVAARHLRSKREQAADEADEVVHLPIDARALELGDVGEAAVGHDELRLQRLDRLEVHPLVPG